MFRYLGLAWNVNSESQRKAARALLRQVKQLDPEWGVAVDLPGLAVCYAGTRLPVTDKHALADGHGVVLGTLFHRADGEPMRREPVVLDTRETARIVSTGGGYLTTRYWGHYVGFVQEEPAGRTWIIRDPLGSLPCFVTEHDGVQLIFSRLEECVQLGLRFSVNWPYVAAHLLVDGPIECVETGLNEVTAIRPGERLEVHGDSTTRKFLWHPHRVATADVIEDLEEATVAMRRVVRQAVHAWAACHDTILHRLSGGLDSAIVLSCLIDAPTRPHVTCMNYYSSGSDSDEREYARVASARARRELVEQPRNEAVRLESILDVAKSPRPARYLYALDHGRLEATRARERGATAVFSGEVGDAIFYQNPVLPAATDFAWRRGVHPALWTVALDVAHLQGVSIWRVLRGAILAGAITKRRWDLRTDVTRYRVLVERSIREDRALDERFCHPWLIKSDTVPPGKLWQLFCIATTHVPFYDPFAAPGDPDGVTPLLSQPVVELALRIPTYVHVTGGWDRSVARRAFLHDLPREIATRRTKGGMEEHVKETLAKNITFVREMLLDGALVGRGMLDRKKLEDVLAIAQGRPTTVRSPMSELYWYLSTEAWLRVGCGTPLKMAA